MVISKTIRLDRTLDKVFMNLDALGFSGQFIKPKGLGSLQYRTQLPPSLPPSLSMMSYAEYMVRSIKEECGSKCRRHQRLKQG